MKTRKRAGVIAFEKLEVDIEHCTRERPIEPIAVREIKAIRSATLCEICGKTFRARDKLLKHVAEIHPNNSIKCTNCEKTFKQKKDLKTHMRRHVKTSKMKTKAVHCYKCRLCSQKFERRKDRTEHIRSLHKTDPKSLTCDKCSKLFTSKSNLRRHRRTRHGESDGTGDASDIPKIFECTICQKTFNRKDSWKRHYDTQHADAASKPQYVCDYCSRGFAAKCTIIAHINVCKMKAAEKLKFKCLHCEAAFCNEHLINQHYTQEHDIQFVYEDLMFESLADFETWRSNLEERTVTQFCNEHGWKTRTHSTKQYKCHRSGLRLAVPEEARKRFPKLAGSKKLDGICPAQIMMRENLEDGRCTVRYQKTHVGHNVCDKSELWFKRLSKEEALRNRRKPRALVAETESASPSEHREQSKKESRKRRKRERCREETMTMSLSSPTDYAENTLQGIITDVTVVTSLEDEHPEKMADDASNITVITSLEDDHPVEKALEDISNIRVVTSPAVEMPVPRIEDISNVLAFVETNRDSILFFKGEGDDESAYGLDYFDVVVVYMDRFQEQVLRRYSHECIAFDIARDPSKFQLHSMLIRDEEWEGVPIAFLLTNRGDQVVVDIFLSSVKSCIGTLTPTIVMSDTSMVYQNAWVEKMAKSEYSFFCSWHVNKQWEDNLIRIAKKEKRRALSRRLYNMAQELDIGLFHEQLESLLADTDPDYAKFVQFFKSNCACTTQYWAYCYRPSSGINTNMSLESLYKMVTGELARALKKESLYECLNALKEYSAIKEKQAERKKLRGQTYDFEKAAILHKRHWQVERRRNTNLAIRTVNAMTWSIQSKEDNECWENYVVQKLDETNECRICDESRGLLRCARCKICFHQFICTCRDCSMRCNMCKHIHALGLYLKDQTLADEFVKFVHESEEEKEEDEPAHTYVVEEVMLSDDEFDDHDIDDHHIENVPIVNLDLQKEQFLQEIVHCISEIQTEKSIEDLKKIWRKSVSSVVEVPRMEDEESPLTLDKCLLINEAQRQRL